LADPYKADSCASEADKEESARASRQFLGVQSFAKHLIWGMKQHAKANACYQRVNYLRQDWRILVQQI